LIADLMLRLPLLNGYNAGPKVFLCSPGVLIHFRCGIKATTFSKYRRPPVDSEIIKCAEQNVWL